MIKVLMADDHPVVRRGLKEILTGQIRDIVCGEAKNAQEALDEVQRVPWDLLILDISMPGRSGLDVLIEIKRARPKFPVLVVSAHPEAQYGKRSLMAGASGYMHKDSAPDELVRAVRQILAGGRYVSPAMADILVKDLQPDSERPPHERLSNRELELLRLIGSGQTTAQIAEKLHLGPTTISTYRARLLEKMNMETTAELMNYAIRNGLTG